MNFDFKNMSEEELNTLIANAKVALADKEFARRGRAMNKIREAMMAYCQEFGSLTVEVQGEEWKVDARYMSFGECTIYIG
jgi:hypothetical protein